MKINCSVTGVPFEAGAEELGFIDKVSPTFANDKYPFPAPSICPPERLRQRLAFRNLRNLHRRKCDLSGRDILSMYPPTCPAPVYHSDEYWSDKWDPLSYGRDFDFSRGFFDQFRELYESVPRIHSYVINSENCEYINGAAHCRNCYLSFNMDYCEDSYYLHSGIKTKVTADSLYVSGCELCYQCTDCENCYELLYSDLCAGCTESYFLTSCRRCTNCIACTNLVGKQYYIFNEPSTREEFLALRASFSSEKNVREFAARAREHSLRYPRKYYVGHSNESFTGNASHHVKNGIECFESSEIENCSYCCYVFKASNCMDYTIFGDNSEWMYQCIAAGLNCTSNSFCIGCWGGSSNNLYSMTVNSCMHCFGCASLHRKEYCIFNKQYTKSDYEQLASRIAQHMQSTGEWGKFFPATLSPFFFNESVAFEEYPLDRAEALRRGYLWTDEEAPKKTAAKVALPDRIEDTPDTICNQVLRCEESGLPYKIINKELEFYRKVGIPLPRFAPRVRFQNLLKRRTPRELWDRPCDKCEVPLRSAYKPSRPETVYCEECYSAEVY